MNDDTISRKAAIETIQNNVEPFVIVEPGTTCVIGAGIKEADVIKALECLPSAHQWIPVSERLPECEQEVLICTKKKVYVSLGMGCEWIEKPIITPALYEDGTMLEINSKWNWEDIDYAGWDEEEDCGIIPEGWWENRHFNPDEVYNNPVDKEVIAWMPLPAPYGGERE